MDLHGKTAIVSGASSGIGKATALKMAGAGAKVILVARGEEKLVETKKEIEAAGGRCWMVTADVSDMASCDALVARVDLKSDREASVLRVQAAHAEPGAPRSMPGALANELRLLASWLGLEEIEVVNRGDLAARLTSALG